jgi:hypothetical protein
MRQQFSGDELTSNTIQSLGLAGSSTRLQLRLKQETVQPAGNSAAGGAREEWSEAKAGRVQAEAEVATPAVQDRRSESDSKGGVLVHASGTQYHLLHVQMLTRLFVCVRRCVW